MRGNSASTSAAPGGISSTSTRTARPHARDLRALQAPGDLVNGFVIRHEEDRGYPGFINLIGIESPGLTSSPAIAEMVGEMVDGYL